jgi:allantoin racemase
MIRILYLVPGLMDKEEQKRREKIANTFVSPNTVVEVSAVDSGPISIESAVEEDIAAGEVLKAIVKLQDRYDAIVLGCAGDPGLRAARELSKIPVIGPAEASISMSFLVGDRYGLIVPLDRDVPTFRALTVKYGFNHRLASIVPLNVPVLELGKNIDLIKTRLAGACSKAVGEGAEVLILGCMSLAFILADELVKDSVKVPILNPAKIGVRVAEMFAQFRMGHSRISYPIADYKKLAESVFKGELKVG